MNAQTKVEAATLASAMAAAFGEIEGATKSAKNPHFKSMYADLTSVIEAIKPALIKHGLFFTQRPQPNENGVTITTVLHHASGESLELGSLFVPANKNDAQGFGSALTYARRYALVTAFGVPVEDDDGNAASANRAQGGFSSGHNGGRAASQAEPTNTLREQLEQSVEQESWKPRQSWDGRYGNKTKLREGRTIHHAELERLGAYSTFDDLDGYLASPEYVDYVKEALAHFPLWLEGDIPPELQEQLPPEYIQTFKLEQKARDMIALRGNVAADPVDG